MKMYKIKVMYISFSLLSILQLYNINFFTEYLSPQSTCQSELCNHDLTKHVHNQNISVGAET